MDINYRHKIIPRFLALIKRLQNSLLRRIKERKDYLKYKSWLKENKFSKKKAHKLKEEIRNFKYQPLISIIMPVYNVEVKWIRKAINSIRNQIYTNWELCIADDASTNPKLIKYLKSLEKDPKIKITFREKNGHISEASNTALELAEGQYIALMDNDDIIYPHALAEVVKVLNKNKETDFIYSDEDKITIREKRVEPAFKPDWSPDYLLQTNYICHLAVIRKTFVDSVGGFRRGYEGSQDYDLFLRVTEETNNIKHISDVLYSWRKVPGSTASKYDEKGYAKKASLKALEDTVRRRGLEAEVKQTSRPGFFRIEYSNNKRKTS